MGYDFVDRQYLRADEDEYYQRDKQNPGNGRYQPLSAQQISILEKQNNSSDNWSQVFVSDGFDPSHVRNCKLYGRVRIGRLDSIAHRYHNVTLPVGLYDSTIISCDLGDNVVVNNVRYMSHYIIGNDVMLLNIDELHVTDHAKFGNGIVKDGESEVVRIWIEVRNENAGRKILAYDGMLPGDAWLWSKHRDDKTLLDRFKEFTEKKFDNRRGLYGQIGDRSVVKNTSIIKDVLIGSDAYIKGANKLKNLTIRSAPKKSSQIGEGCELVNGIIGYGCRVFYGVKAVRFVMASHSQLKYGARLINSFLGNNSTISCCEVLNSLIFPGHEQHHNNSFLCAAVVMGQSNIAAGATIGSNHNSRAADGELLANRGFWPGLCVSLKHNSKFASFSLLAKGDYPFELDIRLPFSLVSNDVSNDRLIVMPAYWFEYNMYALARNSDKLRKRDLRTERTQKIEYDFLAPDTINEMFDALDVIRISTATALSDSGLADSMQLIVAGEKLLNDATIDFAGVTVVASDFENSSRNVVISKPKQAYRIYKDLITYYAVCALLDFIPLSKADSLEALIKKIPGVGERGNWSNVGGQIIEDDVVNELRNNIRNNEIDNWESVHEFYRWNGEQYDQKKFNHALSSLLELEDRSLEEVINRSLDQLLSRCLQIKEWMLNSIIKSRSKDYQSRFRKMLYDTDEEMKEVIGELADNSFILQEKEALEKLRTSVDEVRKQLSLK